MSNLFLLMTFALYAFWRFIQKKASCPLVNPILFSAACIIGFLILTDTPYPQYREGCELLQYLLTPATICFAVSMYEQIRRFGKNMPAIVIGVLSGTVAGLASIAALCRIFGFDETLTVSMLPKSITTAIGMALSEEYGGIASISAAVIIVTGCLGNISAVFLSKIFRLKDPVAQGVAIGTSSHAIGTVKAFEISEIAGAVSSLSLTLAGLITVVLFSFIV